jgi:hypothetical protein
MQSLRSALYRQVLQFPVRHSGDNRKALKCPSSSCRTDSRIERLL